MLKDELTKREWKIFGLAAAIGAFIGYKYAVSKIEINPTYIINEAAPTPDAD